MGSLDRNNKPKQRRGQPNVKQSSSASAICFFEKGKASVGDVCREGARARSEPATDAAPRLVCVASTQVGDAPAKVLQSVCDRPVCRALTTPGGSCCAATPRVDA